MLGFFEEFVLFVSIPLIALFVSRQYTYEFSTPKFAILAFTAFIISVYTFLRVIFRRRRESFEPGPTKFEVYVTPSHLLWMLFGLASLISLVNAWRDNPLYFRWPLDISLYLLVNVIASLYFSNKLTEKRNILWYTFLFVIPGLYIAISSIINFYTGHDPLLGKVGEPFIRGSIRSTVGNVIFVANYLNMLLPISLYFVASREFSLYGKRPFWKVLFVKLVSLLSALLIVVVLSVAQTRSEIIALGMGVVVFAIFYTLFIRTKERDEYPQLTANEVRRLHLLTTVLTVALFVLGVTAFLAFNFVPALIGNQGATIVVRFSGEAWSSAQDERFLSWMSAIPIWEKHKLIGQGTGMYKVLDLYGVQEILKRHPEYNYVWNNFKKAHNEYLQQLAETGLLGFVLIIALLFSLAVYVVKNVKSLRMKDDALLFTSLAVSGMIFALQCVFSFPAQLLPNALAATFFISVGLGPYFNNVKHWRLRLGRKLAVVLAILVVLLTGVSAFLRYKHFLAEVYFKNGVEEVNTYYAYINAIGQYRSQLEQVSKLRSDLESLQGQYETLRPENWHRAKREEAQRTGIRYDGVAAESQRVQTIQNIKAQLEHSKQTIENELRRIESEKPSRYHRSALYFLRSARENRAFGKSFFYLANLAFDAHRIFSLRVRLQSDPSAVLNQTYDETQQMIAPEFKHRLFAFLESAVKEKPELVDILSLAEAQALLDAIGLYETSLRLFSERNTYKSIAQRYAQLYLYVRHMKLALGDDWTETFNELEEKLIEEYQRWSLATVTLKPGSWMKFADWRSVDVELAQGGQDVYRLFSSLVFDMLPITDNRVKDFLLRLGEIEIIASQSMEMKNYWGVPDGAFNFLVPLAIKNEDEQLRERLLEMYAPTYEYIKAKLEQIDYRKMFADRVRLLKENIKTLLESDLDDSKVDQLLTIFEDGMNGALERFLSEDFATIERDYVSSLLKNEPRLWPRIGKRSVWKVVFNSNLSYFMEKLAGEAKLSEAKRNQVKAALDALVNANLDNNNFLLAYERYVTFLRKYELLRDSHLMRDIGD